MDDLILDDDDFLLGMFEELAEYGFATDQAWMNMSEEVGGIVWSRQVATMRVALATQWRLMMRSAIVCWTI